VSTVRLALRGLLAKPGLSAALLAVTAFAVGVAAAGAVYLRAAGESILAASLRSAPAYSAGLHASRLVASSRELRSFEASVAAAAPAVPALRQPVAGLETRTPVALAATDAPAVTAYLASRDDLCDHLVLESGRCPRGRSLGTPAEVAVSRRVADRLHLGLSDTFGAAGFGAGAAARRLEVVGIYTPTPRDGFWFGAHRAYFPPPPLGDEPTPLDAVFLAAADLAPVVDTGGLDVRARFDLFLEPDRLRLADAPGVPAAVGRLTEVLRAGHPNVTVLTGLPDLVAKAEDDRQALTVPVLLADLQLASLALLILVVVAAMAAEARAGEVALAKVRGATAPQAFGLASLELAAVAMLALPAGLALGWLGALLVARRQLEGGIPVVVTPPAVAAALAAALVALAAASLAGLGAVRRRVVDQWRHGRGGRTERRGFLLEGVLLLVAAFALANLRAGGTRRATGGYDLLATLAPGLAVLAAALVVGRSLPAVAAWLVRFTGRSQGLATYVGARQVARRGGAALRVVVALAAAFGLVVFAVTVRQDLARNRHDRAFTEVGAAERAEVVAGRDALGPERVAAADPDGRAAMAVLRYPTALRDAPGVDAVLLGIQPDRYHRVGFWRGDFAGQPLPQLLGTLSRPPLPPLDLGRADQLELAAAVGEVRAEGPVRLVALLRGNASRVVRVDLGRLDPGGVRPLRGRLDPAGGPWRLERLWVVREPGVTSAVSVTLLLDSLRAGEGGSWRQVHGFDDPSHWYSLNDNTYAPQDTLAAADGVDGRALAVTIEAPSSGVALGIGHASVPEALPAVVTPAFVEALSTQVGRVVRVRGAIPGDLQLQVAGVARVLPGAGPEAVVAFVDVEWLLVHAQRNPLDRPAANEVWTVGGGQGAAVLDRLAAQGVRVEVRYGAARQEAALARQAPSLALLLLLVGAAAGAALATGGVMLHLYLTGRRRAFELAVLEVFGARRRDLWGPVAVEQGSLVGYGVLGGGLVGLVVALVALPAIPQFVDRPRVPPPIYTPDWAALGVALGLAVLLVAAGLAVVVAGLVRQARPALLREEEP
jgi:putative ABC transport system permease protein